MEHNFWLNKWEKNEIGFHLDEPNSLLANNHSQLSLVEGSRLFLPLCGKTLDISWLLAKGHKVVGSELIPSAIEQLFDELGVEPEKTQVGNLVCYSAPNIDIFVGDIFELTCDVLGPVDAIYDRAALVALPEQTRPKYAAHLMAITHNAQQLVITFEYDQSLLAGPPFCVNSEEINKHYQDIYSVKNAHSQDLAGGLKGKVDAVEHVWVLNPL